MMRFRSAFPIPTESMHHADGIVATLRRSHVPLVTAVPGHGATETFEAWQTDASSPPFSFHEEVAAGMAHGAALLGRRAAVLLKAHGFLKAANAVADSLAAGTTAGLLYVVFHDPTGAHSDSVLDVEGVARELGLTVHRPAHDASLDALQDALRASERQSLPHVVILEAESVHADARPIPEPLPAPTVHYERDAARHVCCPLFAAYQHEVFEARRRGADADDVARPDLPRVPDDLPGDYRTVAEQYVPAFTALGDVGPEVVAGDTTVGSLFCLPPFEAVDLCTYMGGSVPLALGALASGTETAWAVTGDFGFVAAGHLGLLEARARDLPLRVLLLQNGRAQATGGQPVPLDAVETVLAGHQDAVIDLNDPSDADACRDAVDAATQREGLAIVRAVFDATD